MMAIYGNVYLLPNRHCYAKLGTSSQELLGSKGRSGHGSGTSAPDLGVDSVKITNVGQKMT